jgi:ferric-dicitrate binding protein FerR (iron transport regulator)
MKSKSDDTNNVLERNVSTLLEAGGEAPKLADAARARIRAQLVEKHAIDEAAGSRRRSPLIAVGFGLAATVAGALVVTRIGGKSADTADNADKLEDGTTWITDDGGKVTKLGDRRVRVEGAALLDVAPGKDKFVVETARGTIEVVGTRFLVSADANRTTAAVVRGAVRLASSDGNVLLHAGEQGVVELGRPPTRGPAPRLSHLVSWAAQARKKDEHAIRPLRNGTLFARDPNNPYVPESPLPIGKLAVDVVVEDQVARVAIDQTFHNPAPRVMEGMYRFAIPPDASLQRLAMYVNGKLTESAVVERMQARRIYEDVVYRRLDPALLEWAGTGRLSLKVYPLPAQEDKRLVLAYTQSLPKLYDDWTLTVPLPEVDLPVGELDFDVRIKGCANCEVTSTSHKVDVQRTGNDAVVAYKQTSVRIGDSLVLHVRDKRRDAVISSFEDPSDKEAKFVMLRARPDLTAGKREYRPRSWVILDDVSASRDEMARKAQADLIDGFLRELDEDDRVSIVAFDVAARIKLAPTRVMDVDRKAVRAALSSEGGVGATDFGVALDSAARLLANVPPDDAMIVYLGDGVITSGARQLDALRTRLTGKAHFVGVGVGDGPDTQTLEALAAATGGYATTIDLADDVGWRAFDLVAALHTPRVNGLEAKLVDASGTLVPATVYIKTPQLADGEELEVVAKLAGSAPPSAVELTGTLNGAPWQQKVAITGTTHEGGYLPRLWAQRHIAARMLAKHEPVVVPPCVDQAPAVATRRGPAPAVVVCKTELEAREERDEGIRKEIVGLGKKYFLLSRHTSLLVLEDDAMYKKYDVTKGAGDTWAPYALPAKIKVESTRPVSTLADVASDAELVRRPIQVFYNGGRYSPGFLGEDGAEFGRRGESLRWHSEREAGYVGTRVSLGLGRGPARVEAKLADKDSNGRAFDLRKEEREAQDPFATAAAQSARPNDDSDSIVDEKAKRDVVFADEIGGAGHATGTGQGFGIGGGRIDSLKVGKRAIATKGGEWAEQSITYPQRFGYPTDVAYDDLTGFIPALMPDASDGWRKELAMSAGGAKTHPIDDAARAMLDAARRALPSGVYRWDDLEIAVDDARHIGWRRTTGADLQETASFDGTTWTRRYAELGVDVTRTFGDDDIALGMAYLPLWIAEPAHYARWFEVRAKGPHEVTLARTINKKTEIVYVLEFDDAHHLVAMRDGKGNDLLTIKWSSISPMSARVLGTDVALGFNGQPIADAPAWAQSGTAAGVVVELPAHLPAYWDTRLKTLTAGSPEWRRAQRQRMASLAAVNDRPNLFAAFDALRTNGGVELGDVVLASGGIATGTTDPQLAAALAAPSVTKSPVAAYLRAGRSYGQSPKSERMKAQVTTGFVGALWTLRETTALFAADKNKLGVDRLLSLGQRAFDLRLIGASSTTSRYQMKPVDVARAWDSVATGEYVNIARAQAAQILASRGQYDAAADRVVKLVNELDLDAIPPSLQQMQYQFTQSRRGQAGWQLVWATWRDKVLASNSYGHVLSLLPLAGAHPLDTPAILAKAAALAGDDPDRILYVARMAMNHGHAAFGQSLIEPLVKKHPTRELHQLVGNIALNQGKSAEALEHFEAAQDAAGDEAVELSTVRGELSQIITVARQLAVQSTGNARKQAVERAMSWGTKWRAIDPGNAQIDQQLGELQLAVGDKAEAWRQLSSVIERDPMSGDGYQTVANTFESQGRVGEAVGYWHQATIIDQTNPTPRLREAQALIALGRTAEGDAILTAIAGRKWHVRWEGIAYQAKNMLERGKQQVAPNIDE